jgi:hypothetical protein
MRRIVGLLAALLITSCGPVPGEPGRPGGGGRGLNPDACGRIDTSDVGRKLYAFLVASAELDTATRDLESTVKRTCQRMATELAVSTDGDTATVCDRMLKALDENLEVSVSTEQRLVTRTKPPVCTTKVDFAAEVAAQCEASASANVEVHCQGQCSGSCAGACDGTCETQGADGSCDGRCDGVCRGSCSGGCDGYADVQASAECKATAEVRANLKTECTEAEVEVVTENVTVVDASKLDRAVKAIQVGMPALLTAGARAKIVARAVGHWATTGARLAKSGKTLLKELGDRGVCVTAQLAAAVAASARISARIDVSIRVSASVSASAGSN